MAKAGKYEGIEAFGFKLSVYEMKKNYEVHFMFDNPNNLDVRMDKTIQYLGHEGFFKRNKKIKATAIHIASND
tara:strand:+ start:421 stop:639 length:219 start_codon:yes stop_codon:yes gene_type:complete